MHWVDGNPLVYSEWYDPQRKKDENGESVWTVEPMVPFILDMVKPSLKQPLNDPAYKCSVMFPYFRDGWGNWAKIPCNYRIKEVTFLCKHQPPHVKDKTNEFVDDRKQSLRNYIDKDKERRVNTLLRQNVACPTGWTYFSNKCLKLESVILNLSVFFNYSMLEAMCVNVGGNISYMDRMHINECSHLLSVIWKHEYRYGQIALRDGDFCLLVDVNRGNISSIRTFPYRECSARNVLCEQEVANVKHMCPKHTFTCLDGTCISSIRICGGQVDCINREDEEHCSCDEETIKCGNGQCIPISMMKYMMEKWIVSILGIMNNFVI